MGFNDIELAVRENIFDRTHFVIESACRVTPFSQPAHFVDSQVTAQWTQSILLQIEPIKNTDFTFDMGAGYSLERYTHAACYGEIVIHSIEPSVIFPMTFSYSRPNRYGYSQSFLQLDLEINASYFSRSTTIFHRLIAQAKDSSLSSLTLYGKEKISSYSPLDTDFESRYYQAGFVLEHRSY